MNPILAINLTSTLRLKRVAAVMLIFVAVLTAIILVQWPQGGKLPLLTSGGDDLIFNLVLGQLVLLCLFVPGFAAAGIVSERQANTLELLYASRLSPARIVVGKVCSSLIFPLLLLVSGLPFVAMLVWRGEVDPHLFTIAYAILLASAVFLSMTSLAISAYCEQTSSALVLAYLILLVVCGVLLVPAALVIDVSSPPVAAILHYCRALSPIAAAISLFRPDFPGDYAGVGRALAPLWEIFLPASLLVAAGCFVLIIAKLRRPPAEAQPPVSDKVLHLRSLGRKIVFLIDDRKQPSHFGSANPIAQKERRTSSLGSAKYMIRTFYVSILLSLGLAIMSLYGDPDHPDLLAHVATILLALQFALIALLNPSLLSTAISGEIESDSWDALRLTPLGGSKIFWGKILPAASLAFLPLIALLPAYGTICYVNHTYVDRLLPLIPIIVLTVLLTLAVSFACSTLFASSARATVAAYLVVAGLLVLPMLVASLSGSVLDERIAARLAFPSPLLVALSLLPGGDSSIRELLEPHLIFLAAFAAMMLLIAMVRMRYLLRRH